MMMTTIATVLMLFPPDCAPFRISIVALVL
jgi:hypothetical protein